MRPISVTYNLVCTSTANKYKSEYVVWEWEDTKQNECETERALHRPNRTSTRNRKKKCMRASYVCDLKFCGKTILKSYRHKWIFCHLYSSRISHRLRACRQNANIFFFTFFWYPIERFSKASCILDFYKGCSAIAYSSQQICWICRFHSDAIGIYWLTQLYKKCVKFPIFIGRYTQILIEVTTIFGFPNTVTIGFC